MHDRHPTSPRSPAHQPYAPGRPPLPRGCHARSTPGPQQAWRPGRLPHQRPQSRGSPWRG
eukprot:8502576-Pyramimonas_sp.AAC.1